MWCLVQNYLNQAIELLYFMLDRYGHGASGFSNKKKCFVCWGGGGVFKGTSLKHFYTKFVK